MTVSATPAGVLVVAHVAEVAFGRNGVPRSRPRPTVSITAHGWAAVSGAELRVRPPAAPSITAKATDTASTPTR
jgi:hypothetical protein